MRNRVTAGTRDNEDGMGVARSLRRITSGPQESWSTAGRQAASAWLSDRRFTALTGDSRWYAEVRLDVRRTPAPATFDEASDTRFHIDIYSEEWGFFFCMDGRASWIRVTDVAFVHGRDDFALLTRTPSLKNIGTLLRTLERTHQIQFQREQAYVRTNLVNAEPMIRKWVTTL